MRNPMLDYALLVVRFACFARVRGLRVHVGGEKSFLPDDFREYI